VVGVILAVLTVGLVVGVFIWAIGRHRAGRQRRQLAQSQQLALNQPVTPSGYLLTPSQNYPGYPQTAPMAQPVYVPGPSGPMGVPPLPTSAMLPQTATLYTTPYATPQSVPQPVSQSAPPQYTSDAGYSSLGYGAYQGPTSAPGQPQTVPTATYSPTASYPLDAPTVPGQPQ